MTSFNDVTVKSYLSTHLSHGKQSASDLEQCTVRAYYENSGGKLQVAADSSVQLAIDDRKGGSGQ